MIENWSVQLRAVEALHQELLREAERRRLARTLRRETPKAQRPRRLAVLLALLGMQ